MDKDEDYAAYVDARWGQLVRAAMLLGCSSNDAEDLVQTALVRCYRSWDRVRGAAEPDSYVYRILVNCLASSRGRRWWAEQPTADLPDARPDADVADAVVVRQSVQTALGRLDDDHRTVLVLRYYADLSERQVSEALGLPAGTVKSRTSRALSRLALELDDTIPRSTS